MKHNNMHTINIDTTLNLTKENDFLQNINFTHKSHRHVLTISKIGDDLFCKIDNSALALIKPNRVHRYKNFSYMFYLKPEEYNPDLTENNLFNAYQLNIID